MQVASCDARPRTREESNPRPPGSGSRRANHETTPEDQFEQQKSQKTSNFCTSTTPIPAEGRASTAEISKNHGFLHLDHADPRRGSREHRRNRKKTMGFCTSTTPIPAEGRAGTLEIAKNHGFLHLDHADPRRGSRGNFRNRKKPWDHADPRKGSREHRRNRKKPWVLAPRPRRSPQRVDFRVVSSALPRHPKKRF